MRKPYLCFWKSGKSWIFRRNNMTHWKDVSDIMHQMSVFNLAQTWSQLVSTNTSLGNFKMNGCVRFIESLNEYIYNELWRAKSKIYKAFHWTTHCDLSPSISSSCVAHWMREWKSAQTQQKWQCEAALWKTVRNAQTISGLSWNKFSLVL